MPIKTKTNPYGYTQHDDETLKDPETFGEAFTSYRDKQIENENVEMRLIGLSKLVFNNTEKDNDVSPLQLNETNEGRRKRRLRWFNKTRLQHRIDDDIKRHWFRDMIWAHQGFGIDRKGRKRDMLAHSSNEFSGIAESEWNAIGMPRFIPNGLSSNYNYNSTLVHE